MTSPADYAARGWKIFPCHSIQRGRCTCSKGSECDNPGKHPRTKNGVDDASSDPADIQAWLHRWPNSNWAVATGHINGFIVIDIDPRHDGFTSINQYEEDRPDGALPVTLRSATGGGGRHLFYAYPPDVTIKGDNRGKWLKGVDIKSDGGYVILPEAEHISGGTYRWINWLDQPAWLPPDVAEELSRTSSGSGYSGSDLPDTDTILAGVPEGQRDDVLFREACRLRRQLGDKAKNAVQLLILDAASHCTPPFPADQALRKVESAWEQDHSDRVRESMMAQDNGRRLQATKASDIAMTATRWLWEDKYGCWVPMGALVGLGGREGVGKSTVCGHLVAEVTQGQLPGDFHGTQKGVVIVSTEDDWSATIKPRLVAAGADVDRVFQVKAIQPDGLEGTLSLPEDLKRLEEIIREHDVALVILDPLLTLVNKGLDTHKDAEVRRALEPVVRMAHITKASLIGLVHVNKSNEGDLLNRIMASKAMTAVPRGFLFCAKHTPVNPAEDSEDPLFADAEFVFGQIKNNLAKVMISHRYHMETVTVGYDAEAKKDIKASRLVIQGLITQNVEDIVLEQEKKRRNVRTQGAKAETWLVGFLAGKGEMPSSWVINAGEKAGHSRDSIHRARRNLRDRIEVVNLSVVPRQTTWKLLEK